MGYLSNNAEINSVACASIPEDCQILNKCNIKYDSSFKVNHIEYETK